MKTLLTLMAAAAIIAGCATPTPTNDAVVRVEAVAKLAAYTGTRALLIKKPESREALAKAGASLNLLASQERWDATAAALALSSAGLSALDTQEGQLVLTGTLLFLDMFGPQVDLKQSPYAKAFILGAQEGLALALEDSGTRALKPQNRAEQLAWAASMTRPRKP
jgi:hypothetical protein